MFQFQVLVYLPTTPITAVAGIILALRVSKYFFLSLTTLKTLDCLNKAVIISFSSCGWVMTDARGIWGGEICMQYRYHSYMVRILISREIQSLASLTCRKGHSFFFWISISWSRRYGLQSLLGFCSVPVCSFSPLSTVD